MGTLTAVRPPQTLGLVVWMTWRRYLTATQGLTGPAYERAEERAWERLGAELEALGLPAPGARRG